MKLAITISSLLLCFATPVLADTLYSANVGGYPTSSGVGLGVGIGPTGAPYSFGGSYYGSSITATPYTGFNYPYSTTCCGCNPCNNCGTNYANHY